MNKTDDEFLAVDTELQLEELLKAAASVRDQGHGSTVSYSRKVFIPLTRLCRDVCHYCTYAKTPSQIPQPYMSAADVLSVATSGRSAGCKEALFTLGDKPELRYRAARDWLRSAGYESTLHYVAAMAEMVLQETGLLPHINAGLMSIDDMQMLRKVSVSQGLMLEALSPRLGEKGQPHYGSPDKDPYLRLENIRQAGELQIPFTTGILVGIGETRTERLHSLRALKALHDEYGHIQEIIIQNFRAKSGTKMAQAPEPGAQDLMWTIAAARLIFGPTMNLQVPPNLNPGLSAQLIHSGINDWGGVSPVTPDHVNPEAAWPELDRLDAETANAGKTLVERLAIYPAFIEKSTRWLDPLLEPATLRLQDGEGYAHEDSWRAGDCVVAETRGSDVAPAAVRRPTLDTILQRANSGDALSRSDIVELFSARGSAVDEICSAADALRRQCNGDAVTYVINRNINYTNVCYFKCGFCAFSKGSRDDAVRGKSYDLALEEIVGRAREAADLGATEVCLQGGIHPRYTGDTYLDICRAIKSEVPEVSIHAFSPLEVWQGAETLGISLGAFLEQLKSAGLGSLPGTAAEILHDQVRAVICPDKISTRQWMEVVTTAHKVGLTTTSTIMFGHVEQYRHLAAHLLRLRSLQIDTGGITEFVPLPFVHMDAPIYIQGRSRQGPSFREAILMHAIARLSLFPHINNIQTSWTKMGVSGAAACLQAGCNDLGGTLMNESISRAAGAAHGQELPAAQMEQIIGNLGRHPQQRTTRYEPINTHKIPRGPHVHSAPVSAGDAPVLIASSKDSVTRTQHADLSTLA
jgi:FO synthase